MKALNFSQHPAMERAYFNFPTSRTAGLEVGWEVGLDSAVGKPVSIVVQMPATCTILLSPAQSGVFFAMKVTKAADRLIPIAQAIPPTSTISTVSENLITLTTLQGELCS